MRRAHERPARHGLPQPWFSKEARRVRDGLCHTREYLSIEVRHDRYVSLSAPRLGAQRIPQGAAWPDPGLPPAWMDQEHRAEPAFLPGPDKAPNECRFS